MKSGKPLHTLVLFATLFAMCVVILGAWTRLEDAGLGCPDWPGCYGFLTVPETAEEIAQAEAAFPDAPFEAHKAWPEVIHRYFASTLGLLIVIINIIAWKHRKKTGPAFQAAPVSPGTGHSARYVRDVDRDPEALAAGGYHALAGGLHDTQPAMVAGLAAQ